MGWGKGTPDETDHAERGEERSSIAGKVAYEPTENKPSDAMSGEDGEGSRNAVRHAGHINCPRW